MAEFLDVLDENGNSTGRTKLKQQVHSDGDWHRAAHVWIVNSKGQLLIQKRSANKDSYPNMWHISAAGRVSAGEDTVTAAIREIEEELGIKVSPKQLEKLFTAKSKDVLNDGKYFNNEFDDVFLAHIDLNPSMINFQKSEIAEVKYIDFKELERLLRSGYPGYVPKTEEYYNKLFGLLRQRYVFGGVLGATRTTAKK